MRVETLLKGDFYTNALARKAGMLALRFDHYNITNQFKISLMATLIRVTALTLRMHTQPHI